MKMYLISEQDRQALIDYLANRPYREVAQGINALATLKEYVEVPEEEKRFVKKPEKVE